MSIKRIFYVFLVLLMFYNCKNYDHLSSKKEKSETVDIKIKTSKLTSSEWKNWQHKDYDEDTIVGVSLDKAYEKILSNKKYSDTIIVALIDGRIDTSHEDIKDSFWINHNEIPNNNIDDDNNGYVDDVNGWNYLGNRNGIQLHRSPYEYVRVLNKYENYFKDKTVTEIAKGEIQKFNLYKRALKAFNDKKSIVADNLFYLDSLINAEIELKEKIQKRFPNQSIDENFIDSLIELNSEQKNELLDYKSFLKNKDWAKNRRIAEERYLTFYLNKEYHDRDIIGDKEDYINFADYGNPFISIDTTKNRHNHAIQIIGIIAANRTNNLGVLGVTNTVKIMPLAVAPFGDVHDKDLSRAIKYAVDNGAKIINMSLGKEFSLHENWVVDALKYAEKKDVLVITSSGNESLNLDKEFNYPNDAINHSYEFVNNFIKVGATTFKLYENLAYSSSNYGKKEVDIFAPGEYIYTTRNDNKYDYSSGTSCSSAIVSGIAALIRSYYPNLTAAEVKQIIMESGVSYDIMVNKPSTSTEKELVPFSSLSKSGKIVNAYNALLMAEEVSKKKKKN